MAADQRWRAQRRGGESLSHFVTRTIRDAIVSGQLAPGERIPQEQIGSALDVSRIPVREALRQLESEGLVRLTPNSFARVAKLDIAEVREIYLMRERIEPLAMELSMPGLTETHLRRLDDLRKDIDANRDNSEMVLQLDRDFHLACYEGAPTRIRRLVGDFWNATQHARRAYANAVASDDEHEVMCAEHYLIYVALREGNSEQAGALMRSHIARTRLRLERERSVSSEV
ncbi:GntR family transcriptional regulator [Actinomadura viridis]|uniref:DNA-binding GntR family transcriptional regulator n=1 Tax=Actinomadura viridis TaxID=58110 RepID=A0A931DEA6_9ACTN|nr:GntR family transcriptional regulator [Actinomadura viridis]MBG6085981.1 DNA-binding GntR family transcriptional regulator [Actinomadura viridis]